MHRSLVLLGLVGVVLRVCGRAAQRRRAGRGSAPVRPGIEVLLDDSLHLVRDRRVGLVTNQAGVDARRSQ